MIEPCIHLKIKGKKKTKPSEIRKRQSGTKIKIKKKNTYSRVYKQRGKYTRFF